jgi:hypothetical protein
VLCILVASFGASISVRDVTNSEDFAECLTHSCCVLVFVFPITV